MEKVVSRVDGAVYVEPCVEGVDDEEPLHARVCVRWGGGGVNLAIYIYLRCFPDTRS